MTDATIAKGAPIEPGLVSVLIPMRNGRDYIAAALRSILDGCTTPIEVVVIDDGSTDGSAQVVGQLRDERVRVMPGPCEGNIARTLNAGLSAVRGDVLMRCDADDLFVPGRVDRQARWLAEHPDYVAVCGTFETIDARGRSVAAMHRDARALDITDELRLGQTRTHLGTFAIRTEAARAVGGFRPYFVVAEDLDFQCRLAERGRVWFEPEVCYRYRLHDASITHTQATARREFLTQTARRFALQRQQTGSDDLQRGRPPTPPDDATPASRVGDEMRRILVGQAWHEHRRGQRLAAIRTGWRALGLQPASPRSWWTLLMLAVKPSAGKDPDAR